MPCITCGYEIESGGSIRIQLTEIGDLEADLALPSGGIDCEICSGCWRWTREIADDPEKLAADAIEPDVAEVDLEIGGSD